MFDYEVDLNLNRVGIGKPVKTGKTTIISVLRVIDKVQKLTNDYRN